MTIITRWNSLFNWRYADVSPTNVLDEHCDPKLTYVLSAPAWGLKGKLPGARHTWLAKKSFVRQLWRTIEISDLETLQYQKATCLYNKYADPYEKQIVVSDRDPSAKWFGSEPRLDGVFETNFIPIWQLRKYPFRHTVSLTKNNCNTFVSFIAWQNNWDLNLNYVGFKDSDYWDKMLDKRATK